mmetsp:Transcript_5523/g.14005  ORF Transcript_5523/g.14005 Transcript_5523/m.14005 type:complete len:308 (+) Transcript_5523:1555-2478(+)
MWIAVNERKVEKLREEYFLSHLRQHLDLRRFALRQLLAVHKLCHKHSRRAQTLVHLRNVNAILTAKHTALLKKASHAQLIVHLVKKVELGVETHRPLVEQGDVVCALVGSNVSVHETLVDLRSSTKDVEILRGECLHRRTLHLHGNGHGLLVVASAQDRRANARLVHLRKRSCGDGLGRDLLEYFIHRCPELALDSGKCDGGVELRHAILQLRKLVHGLSWQDIRTNAQHLPNLDVRRTKLLHALACLLREASRVALELIATSSYQHACDAREEGHARTQERRPTRLELARTLVPVFLNRLAIVAHG